MDIEVIGTDQYGTEAYKSLFNDTMSDIGKAAIIEKALLVLKPEIPLFIFSLRLRAEPVDKKISDVANLRKEGKILYVTITDERYAPTILDQLWTKYGRDNIDQQTRFDITVTNANEGEVENIVVASNEESVKEIVGALWRSMPEGIKNRHTFIDESIITTVATEEILEPQMLEEAKEIHAKMRGEIDV